MDRMGRMDQLDQNHLTIPMSANTMPEYWDNLDPMYSNPDHQHSHPPQHPPAQHQSQPLGISWDHPVFPPQNPPSHAPQDQNHGIYSAAPQSWQPNSITPTPTPAGFGLPQYQQVPHYSQGNVPFDSRSINPSENPSFSPYPFPQHYYPQRLPQQSPIQSAQYPVAARFPEEASHTPINFPAGYPQPSSNVVDHRTINPQYLGTPQPASAQHPSLQNNFLYVSPADFERADNGKRLNFYRQDLQVPAMGPTANGQSFQQMQNIMPAEPVSLAQLQNQRSGPSTQPQPRKKATAATGKKSTNSPISDSDGSDLEIQEADEPSPVPPTRPTDEMGAAKYDTMQAVWSPRNKPPEVDKVKNAMVTFKDVVKSVRDAWKESTQAMKMAENKGENDKATKIKEDVVLRRRVINAVVTTALEKGHPRIVEKLGEHPMAVSALYSFLLDRHQACDIDGELTVNILKLLARFTTIDEDILQKTNVAKLLPRFSKKGGAAVKKLSQEILDNAAASTKRKQDSPPKEEPPRKSPTPSTASMGELAGSKRPRETDTNGLPGSKRIVTSQPKNTKPSASAGSAKRPETGQDSKAAAATSRPKANIVAPKPTNLFGSLSSASKRPGTSNAERAAAAAKAGNGSPEKKENAPPPKPTFSFGDLLADLNKQKPAATAEPAEDKPPETEEEREKRLRKESRRKLRVSWKPDESLAEVRLFTHDPDEELGPGDRSIGDVKGEGSVLKLHKDLDELEKDDEGIKEETLLDYRPLTEIDLGGISPENFIKRAGNQQPVSQEREAQNHREATTLMVFYTSPAEVPPSPKEPPSPDPDEMVRDEVSFGDLPEQVQTRQNQYRATTRSRSATPSQPNTQSNHFDISNLLRVIAPQQQQPTPPPQPVTQAPMSDLERTVNLFRQQQQPVQPQMPQYPTTQAPGGFDFQKLLSALNVQPQMQQPPVVPTQPPAAAAPNLAAIVSQFANQNQQGGAGQGLNPGQFHEDPERKRMRERGYDDSYDDKFNPPKRTGQIGLTKHPKAGLVPCRYWREGKCVKGDECTFRHDSR